MRQNLYLARKQHGKTQQQIADYANISLKSYQRIELGKQNPSVSIAIIIAEALRIKSYEEFKELFVVATPESKKNNTQKM